MENEVSRPFGSGTPVLRYPSFAHQSAIRTPQSAIPAFTLVEMLAVVGIIGLLLAISLPGITRVWEERKVSQAITMVRGLLQTTRAQAMRTSERGLFFYIDPVTGTQRVAPIVADPPLPGGEFDLATNPPTAINPPISQPMAVNRFIVAAGDIHTLPAPIRVVPRSIVDTYANPPKPFWPEPDIAHEGGSPMPNTGLMFPRHRNFFAMVFGPDGKLMVGRDVLIHDPDAQPAGASGAQGDNKGDRTGLYVEQAADYYHSSDINGDGTWTDKSRIDPTGGNGNLFDMVVEWTGSSSNPTNTQNAVNFRSVDGLLVYDDSILRDIPEDTTTANGMGTLGKRGYLLREGLPIYVSRLTGEVIEGPKGEAQ